MSQVHLDVVPDTAHVRVVRLVAVSLARVHGVDEDVVEDIRLAVGEACGRAVAAHTRARVDGRIRLRFAGTPGLSVEVRDGVALPEADGEQAIALLAGAPDGEASGSDPNGGPGSLPGSRPEPYAKADTEAAPQVMALLAGLADELDVHTGADGTSVQLRWTTRT